MPTQNRDNSLSNTLGDRILTHPLLCTTQVAAFLLLTMAFPSLPAAAIYRNPFQTCSAEMLKAGISPEQASSACAGALYPQQLSNCVLNIKQVTSIALANTVSACYQVRRPVDLATCVTNISRVIPDTVGVDVLNNCRRSLLPIRFSECVIGFNREMDVSAPTAMTTCIDARD